MISVAKTNKVRCSWVPNNNALYENYHDKEWGVPVHDDQKLFEFLILEGAQAGLSWETILKRREGYKNAFANFNPNIVSQFDENDFERLCNDAGIIRNKLKIKAAIKNAQEFLNIQKEYGSFNHYVWEYVGGKTIVQRFTYLKEYPLYTKEAKALSDDLKKRGFSFVGPTVIYSFMQACGLVDDHQSCCFKGGINAV